LCDVPVDNTYPRPQYDCVHPQFPRPGPLLTEQTLRILLADHLNPTLNRIEGELNDLRAAQDGADKKAVRAAEKQYDGVLKARDELQAFIADVEQCADRGAPPTDANCRPREQNARYSPDLDDGVMINSAALWPLLEPQWKDPKKWWKQLSEAKGKKDYDWSHLAMRYWPTRVDEKCQRDPSLGVAHGCFWRYHPERAWAWELRLQQEIGPDFRIDEVSYRPGGRDLGDQGSGPHREAWLSDHAHEALIAVRASFRVDHDSAWPLHGSEVVMYAEHEGVAHDVDRILPGGVIPRGLPVAGTRVLRGAVLGRLRLAGSVLSEDLRTVRPDVIRLMNRTSTSILSKEIELDGS
jgi:hypothetical protein